jgi:hypothetical protein
MKLLWKQPELYHDVSQRRILAGTGMTTVRSLFHCVTNCLMVLTYFGVQQVYCLLIALHTRTFFIHLVHFNPAKMISLMPHTILIVLCL